MALASRLLAIFAAFVAILVAVAFLVVFGPGTPSAHAATHAITMAHYAFGPARLTVRVGDTIAWTNTDSAPHDVSTTSAPVAIHSPTITTGQSWSYTFTVAGTYQYICSIHPDMRATITVEPATTSTSAPSTRRNVGAAAAPDDAAPPGSVITAPPAVAKGAKGSVVPATPHSSVAAGTTLAPGGAATAVITTNSQAASTTSGTRLKPLLLVAGLVAAIATLCLLILASTPKGGT